jgi:hypothetical protein
MSNAILLYLPLLFTLSSPERASLRLDREVPLFHQQLLKSQKPQGVVEFPSNPQYVLFESFVDQCDDRAFKGSFQLTNACMTGKNMSYIVSCGTVCSITR